MSVIIGLKTDDKIILAGDKRGSTETGEVLTDELEKIILVNNSLCIATAGNRVIEQAILIKLHEKEEQENICIEDVLDTIHEIYMRIEKNGIPRIGMYSFSFIVGGIKRNGTADLVAGQNKNGIIDHKSVSAILFSPADCVAERCYTILAVNLRFNRHTFIEKTIADIAKISNVVSAAGDKWIYNVGSGKGEFSSF